MAEAIDIMEPPSATMGIASPIGGAIDIGTGGTIEIYATQGAK
jgi:hypothetical protein